MGAPKAYVDQKLIMRSDFVVPARLEEKHKQSVAGFSLVEVLVAIVVLTAALLAMASLTGSIMNYDKFADHTTKATTLAQDKIEEFKNGSFASITSSGSAETVETHYSRSWTVTDTVTDLAPTAATLMKTVSVIVAFNWQGSSHQVELRTIIVKDN
jgi:Tfp pilus assembly protein PilV